MSHPMLPQQGVLAEIKKNEYAIGHAIHAYHLIKSDKVCSDPWSFYLKQDLFETDLFTDSDA